MPAGYTHYVFGEQVLSQLDENIKKRIMPGTLTVAEPLILKNVDYNVIFLSNF